MQRQGKCLHSPRSKGIFPCYFRLPRISQSNSVVLKVRYKYGYKKQFKPYFCMPLPKKGLRVRIDSALERYITRRAKKIGKHRKNAIAARKQAEQARVHGKHREAARAESAAFSAETWEQGNRTLKGDAIHARALLRAGRKKK